MRLRAIRVRDVGPFRDGLSVEGLSGGLDVLIASNEAGKSTVFRSVETLFFEKYDTTKASVMDMVAATGSATIEADFEAAGGLWRVTKSFGRQKKARLLSMSDANAKGAEYTGAEAEARLAALVGLEGGKPGPLGFLWVGQGGALEPRAPEAKRAEAAPLKEIIEREVAELTGAGRLRRLREEVTGELSCLATEAKRHPKAAGPWGQAIRRRDEIAADVERARAARDASEQRLAERARLIVRRDELAAPPDVSANGIEAATRVRDAALEAVASAETSERRYDAARARRLEADRERERAEARTRELTEAADRIAAIEADLEELDPQLATARSEYDRLGRDHAEAEAVHASLESALGRLEHETARARRSRDAKEAARQFEETSRRLSEATSLDAKLVELSAAIEANPATAAALDELARAEAASVRAADALAASAPRVEIKYAPDAERVVLVDGRPAPEGIVTPSSEGGQWPLQLLIPGVGTIIVDAGGGSDRKAQERAHAEAKEKLRRGLAALGVGTFREARSRFERRQDDERERAEARARLSGIAPHGTAALASEAERLRALAAEDVPDTPDLDAVTRDLETTRAKRAEAAKRLASSREASEAAGRTLAGLEARVQSTRDALGGAQQDALGGAQQDALGGAQQDALGRAQRETPGGAQQDALGRAQRKTPGGARQENLHRAQREDATADASPDLQAHRNLATRQLEAATSAANAALREEVALREAVLPPVERAKLIGQRDHWQAVFDKLVREKRDIDLKLERISGEQSGAEQGGTADLERLEEELAEAEEAVARYESEVAGLVLLEGLVDDAVAAARDHMIEPVLRRLSPYLEAVLPGSAIMMGDDLAVAGLIRNGGEVPLSVLSGGTREQIAVMARLAYARVLAENGRPTPVILDDALVYSDDARLAAMFKALEMASEHHQVLVLSCHARWFSGLGGNRIELGTWTGKPVG